MESTQDMEYAASGMEIEALFALDPTPLQGLDYGQYTIDMIEQYKALGFQAQRIGIGTENFIVYSTVSQDPRCYSIVRLVRGDSMEEGQSAGQFVYMTD